MADITRRAFLGTVAAGTAAVAAQNQNQPKKGRPHMYSVVRVTVKETREYCPFYKKGDVFYIRQQCFDPKTATPKQFCMHSLKDVYATYMKVRKGPVGNMATVGCMDEGIAQFEVERLADEEGPGWNRPPEHE